MITHKLVRALRYQIGGSDVFTQKVEREQSAGAENNIDESLTDASDQLIAYALDISQCKMLAIWATGSDITLKTNDSASPDDSFTLAQNQPIVWSTDDDPEFGIPLSADITALYATNTGTGQLHIRALHDPTV